MHGKGDADAVRAAFHGFVKAGPSVILSEESFMIGCGPIWEESATWELKIKRLAWMMEGLDCEYWMALRDYRSLTFSYFIELGKLTLRPKAPAPSWWLRESNAFGMLRPAELAAGLAPLQGPVYWMDFEEVTRGALNQQILGLDGPLPHRHRTKTHRTHSVWRGRRGMIEEFADTMRPSLVRTMLRGWIRYGKDITRNEEVEVKRWDAEFWADHLDLEEAWETFRKERLENAGVMEHSRLRLG